MTGAADRIRARIARQGPVPWSAVVEEALYGPAGFYTAGGGAGRQRDFLTSPEVGPLFGAVVAGALDAAWAQWGRPDPWVVVEAGAGAGTLAASVLAAGPACAPALRYIAVERSAFLRAAAAAVLPLEDPAQILGPQLRPARDPEDDDVADGSPRATGVGPLVTLVPDLPAVAVTGVVLANELLDNLAFDLYRRRGGDWYEVRVGLDGQGLAGGGLEGSVLAGGGLAGGGLEGSGLEGSVLAGGGRAGGGLVELDVPAAGEQATRLNALVPDAPDGAVVPWESGALEWLRRALGLLAGGRLIVVDYARSTAELARLPVDQWLRTYRGGGRGGDPLDDLGAQDITVDVALDQLGLVRPASRVEDQAGWLDRHGLRTLEAAAAAGWREGAARGDLQALKHRSRVSEAATLREAAGLGGFTVCEWDIGVAR